MTGYQSWSVVFGEQPSAAKWNILGTNDAAFNDGTGIGNGAINFAHLLSTIFSGQVTATTNGGGGGGTLNYINLGGIKLAWGITNASSSIGTNLNQTLAVTLTPAGFSSITAAVAVPFQPGDNRISGVISSQSTTTLNILLQSNGAGSTTSKAQWFVIGT